MYQAGVSCSGLPQPAFAASCTRVTDPDLVCAGNATWRAGLPTTGHHGHAAGQVQCVDCHMPERVYMVSGPAP